MIWLSLLVGLGAGVFIGIFVSALFEAGKGDDEE